MYMAIIRCYCCYYQIKSPPNGPYRAIVGRGRRAHCTPLRKHTQYTRIHLQKPELIPIMDFQSPVACKCFLFPGVLCGVLYVCVCMCNMLERSTNLSISTQNLQCIWTLNSLLTVGGTLFLAMHRYLPMSVLCTLLSSNVSPLTVADSKKYEYNISYSNIVVSCQLFTTQYYMWECGYNYESYEGDTSKNVLLNLKSVKCQNK